MREVAIVGYLRSPQSRSRPKEPERDDLGSIRADELLARVIQALIQKTGIDPGRLDDFLVGSAFGVSENWTYGGRTPVFLANLPETVPAKFLDMQCASGMAAIHTGWLEIAAQAADTVMASGMEHMTRVPMGPTLFEQGTLSVHPGLSSDPVYAHWDIQISLNMGLTAEKLASISGISRRAMDEWAVRSHNLAVQARKSGFFDAEILPIEVRPKDGPSRTVTQDQAVREGTTLEGLSQLKPLFNLEGSITAGNASPLNAGAAGLLLMAREEAKTAGLPVLGIVRAMGVAGVDPTCMGQGPVPAVRKALNQAGLSVQDIDFWEINEAFSVVALYAIQELGIDPDLVNVMGGGLALGHPLGATGVRLIGTLARILEHKEARYGCATACVGEVRGLPR
ncbi:MAG: acetyl-CoA C-acetyltransferase [Desulfovermiculus sp.]|nr:acetyl-CoA C-acetyltransferase [Desulfovermiculus sp.]